MERLFRDAGLVGVRTAHRQVQAVLRDAEHLLQFIWSHGQRAMWEAVPEAEHDGLRAQVRDVVARVGGADGSLRFDQDVRITLGTRA